MQAAKGRKKGRKEGRKEKKKEKKSMKKMREKQYPSKENKINKKKERKTDGTKGMLLKIIMAAYHEKDISRLQYNSSELELTSFWTVAARKVKSKG